MRQFDKVKHSQQVKLVLNLQVEDLEKTKARWKKIVIYLDHGETRATILINP